MPLAERAAHGLSARQPIAEGARVRPEPEQQTGPAVPAGDGTGGPAAARLRLGAQLRQLRETAGITRRDAAQTIRSSVSKFSRFELGRTGIRQRDLSDLLDMYGAGPAVQTSMMALARIGANRDWWQAHGDAVPASQALHLGLEPSASLIRGYEPRFVPWLLQTPEYTRILLTSLNAGRDADLVERQAAVLLERQQILHRQDPPRLWLVIDEGALRRLVGGPAVMRAQLEYLIDTIRLCHVNIQILPFRAGGQVACSGAVSLLRFTGDTVPDVVCLGHFAGATYPSRPAEIGFYWDILNQLATAADPPIASALTLERLLRDL
jgi:hypothetical protein